MHLKQFSGYNVVMKSDIEKIIADGVHAPSGENCQPWRFEVTDNRVSVYNLPDADQSLYNSKQKGSHIAHGALLENLVISGQHYGYATSVTLFPETIDETHIADVIFSKEQTNAHPLYEVIHKRCTNRKNYTGETLTAEQKEALRKAVESDSQNKLVLIDDEAGVKKAGAALGIHEQVLFENKHLHDFFYSHLLWNLEDEHKSGGFYFKTLEFLPHQLGPVKLFKKWALLSFLNPILKVSKMIGKENGEKYGKSGTIGVITMTGSDKKDYVEVGRLVQRMWLTSELHHLALHPCNGIAYLNEYIHDSEAGVFSKNDTALLQRAHSELMHTFGTGNDKHAFTFRIGKAESPSARAKRLPPIIIYTS
jgi:hypothetical protein